jgi:hypothetical protein
LSQFDDFDLNPFTGKRALDNDRQIVKRPKPLARM